MKNSNLKDRLGPMRIEHRPHPISFVTVVIVVILVSMKSADKVNCMSKQKPSARKESRMATSRATPKKSAEDLLLDSFGDLIDTAAAKMTDQEFKKAEKKSNESLARALARPKQRRETA